MSLTYASLGTHSTDTSTATNAATVSIAHASLGSASGGECATLEAKQAYYLSEIEELIEQEITVPAYLAGYASAAYDSLERLGCPLGGRLRVLL
ncbi:hypothetical protein IMSHALPRED_007971 [Imshaugia aleurites]|uniref:Uncharacterized protein n=1 Tax=Imshaugia aleurites TaxID=172621 RepID=A0A8H3FRS9_9LECA|nr:hypothetical protein IMSHALPRED_007971 [Imshaugia aleurites]